jgi:Undecaprenyl-phosphate galactose phosphotransferase WbaP
MATQTHSPLAIHVKTAARPAVVCHARPAATRLTLLASDAGAVFLARILAVYGWQFIHPSIGASNLPGFWLSLGLFVFIYAVLNLYSGAALGPVEELRGAVLGTVFVWLFVIAALFFLQHAGSYSRGLLALSGFLTAMLVPLGRASARNLFAGSAWWGVPVVVLGAGKTARLLIERPVRHPEMGIKPIACRDDDALKSDDCAGVPAAGPLSMAHAIARPPKIRHALIAMPGVDRRRLLWIMEHRGAAFPHLIPIPNLMGVASLSVSPRDLGGVLGLELRQNLLSPLNGWIKRAIDIAGAAILGLLALPIVACAVVWIKLVSPGRAFYRQEREGESGRRLAMPKLRTMHPDAETLLFRVLSESPELRAEWTCHFKLKKDPRILPGIGRFLRQTSLDELPQLWSVLKGEMSLVGPRPFPVYHVEKFSPRFRTLRSRVKPGLTGLWQVSDRSNGDLDVQEALDTYYIRNWSFWLDLYILARTVRAVLFPAGAY